LLFLQIWGAASIGQKEKSKWAVSVLHFEYVVDLLAGVAPLLVGTYLEND